MRPQCFCSQIWPSRSGISSNCPLRRTIQHWSSDAKHSLELAQVSIGLLQRSTPVISPYIYLRNLILILFPSLGPLSSFLLWLMFFYLEWPDLRHPHRDLPLDMERSHTTWKNSKNNSSLFSFQDRSERLSSWHWTQWSSVRPGPAQLKPSRRRDWVQMREYSPTVDHFPPQANKLSALPELLPVQPLPLILQADKTITSSSQKTIEHEITQVCFSSCLYGFILYMHDSWTKNSRQGFC